MASAARLLLRTRGVGISEFREREFRGREFRGREFRERTE
jgi:hypothetical protein